MFAVYFKLSKMHNYEGGFKKGLIGQENKLLFFLLLVRNSKVLLYSALFDFRFYIRLTTAFHKNCERTRIMVKLTESCRIF